jgi:predicted AlkP superfamily phosphohydrolase/phosphomutase
MLVFTGTDRLVHFLWDAYENEDHRYRDVFQEHFRKIDRAIGEISDRPDAGIVPAVPVVSDVKGIVKRCRA